MEQVQSKNLKNCIKITINLLKSFLNLVRLFYLHMNGCLPHTLYIHIYIYISHLIFLNGPHSNLGKYNRVTEKNGQTPTFLVFQTLKKLEFYSSVFFVLKLKYGCEWLPLALSAIPI